MDETASIVVRSFTYLKARREHLLPVKLDEFADDVVRRAVPIDQMARVAAQSEGVFQPRSGSISRGSGGLWSCQCIRTKLSKSNSLIL